MHKHTSAKTELSLLILGSSSEALGARFRQTSFRVVCPNGKSAGMGCTQSTVKRVFQKLRNPRTRGPRIVISHSSFPKNATTTLVICSSVFRNDMNMELATEEFAGSVHSRIPLTPACG